MKGTGKIYDFLKDSKAKTILLYGSAGASKSWTLGQYLIINNLIKGENKSGLITRKTNASLPFSTYKLITDLLKELQVPYDESKSLQTITMGKNSILFRGMDDPEKIKSSEFNYIWMEEANEFTEEDYQQLKLRLRRATNSRNQIYLTFNPLISSWIYDFFFVDKKEKDIDFLKAVYQDNPFLAQDYIDTLEGLKDQNITFYKIYALGEFAQPEHIIFTNYKVVSILPDSFDEIIYGLDFGYNNPSVLLKIGIKDNVYYVIDELYQSKLTNTDLIERLKELRVEGEVYCDSAEPNRIEELSRAGFRAEASNKSVKDGIDTIKAQKLCIYEKCLNTLKEIRTYAYKVHNGLVLDEPVKFMDHAMDAMRYAIYTYSLVGGGIPSIFFAG